MSDKLLMFWNTHPSDNSYAAHNKGHVWRRAFASYRLFFFCLAIMIRLLFQFKIMETKLEAAADIMSVLFPPLSLLAVLSLVSATEFNYSHTPI